MPPGHTGVIQGVLRNANVVANQEVPLLIIPKQVYLLDGHDPYTADELRQMLSTEQEL